MNEKINIDELKKSLIDLGVLTDEEISETIAKAEENNLKFDKEKDDDKTLDKEKQEAAKDSDDMKKAYDKVMSAKSDFDKSMTEFLDKFGNAPGIKTPDTDLSNKSEKIDIEKSEVNDIQKAFDSKFESIEKSVADNFEIQRTFNENLIKSLEGISSTVEAIAQTPNPLKGLFGNYKGFVLEKGDKTNEDGKRVISLRNKDAAVSEFMKSIDKISDEQDKQTVKNMINSYIVNNRIDNPMGLDIVKKALDIDFEK